MKFRKKKLSKEDVDPKLMFLLRILILMGIIHFAIALGKAHGQMSVKEDPGYSLGTFEYIHADPESGVGIVNFRFYLKSVDKWPTGAMFYPEVPKSLIYSTIDGKNYQAMTDTFSVNRHDLKHLPAAVVFHRYSEDDRRHIHRKEYVGLYYYDTANSQGHLRIFRVKNDELVLLVHIKKVVTLNHEIYAGLRYTWNDKLFLQTFDSSNNQVVEYEIEFKETPMTFSVERKVVGKEEAKTYLLLKELRPFFTPKLNYHFLDECFDHTNCSPLSPCHMEKNQEQEQK